MKAWVKWGLVIVAAATVDLTVRFAARFDLARVLQLEAVLFPAAALALLALMRREPRAAGWARAWRVGLILAFLLGGLRAGLWASGMPVHLANLAVLAVAAAGLAAAWLLARRPPTH
jgi:hypothetical protein